MNDGHVLHFFAGKGGVGKTTLAAAYALNLAEKYPKEKILLISSDGNGALSDLLKKKLSGKPSKLVPGKGTGALFASEYDAAAAMTAFLKDYEPALRAALVKGALLSEDELHRILQQTFPGLEELVFLLGVQAELEGKVYDRVVVDTAPTSHTLRLVDQPQALRKLLSLLSKSGGKAQEKARSRRARARRPPLRPRPPPGSSRSSPPVPSGSSPS